MDDELASLSLKDGEDDVILVRKDFGSQLAVNDYNLIRMSKRQELVDIGLDLSLRAPLKRAAVMSSIWLVRKSGEGKKRPHQEIRNYDISGGENSIVVRKERPVGKTHILLMAAKWQVDQSQ
ncbi:hypothetical protein PVK06_011266 [Gossypium arboreum]|uniref:Uncharacterized protein n=1 Tax=Gossypium arboreum TaxID=29729 RepID=A0ABR0Q8Q5_GOSAR|nr:hypothetical protein PVK06_011266 [Gossypium arboreum]